MISSWRLLKGDVLGVVKGVAGVWLVIWMGEGMVDSCGEPGVIIGPVECGLLGVLIPVDGGVRCTTL